jgi:transcriptional antiterminator RfaH
VSCSRSIESADGWTAAAVDAVPDAARGTWWVAHTRPRAEKVLSTDLARLGIHHYLPLRIRVTRSRGANRVSRSMVPVFSGYLFFVADEAARLQALATHRIVSTLAVPRQKQLVAELRHLHAVLSSGAGLAHRKQLQRGRWVRIIAGPLVGVEGIVRRWRSQTRLALNVNILGQSVAVDVDPAWVEPIDVPEYAKPD